MTDTNPPQEPLELEPDVTLPDEAGEPEPDVILPGDEPAEEAAHPAETPE